MSIIYKGDIMEHHINLLKRYENSPIIRSLIQLIPCGVGSALDTAITIKIINMREKRLRVFYDKLGEGDIILTPDLLESEDFLHYYISTYKAVINTKRSKKVEFFAKLLKAYIIYDELKQLDEYEDYLKILDDLSYRELVILIKLETCESKYSKEDDENDLQYCSRYWDEFKSKLIFELRIQEDEIESLLTRLNRTGCYETFTGNYLDYTGGKGRTTPTFKKLKKYIME